MAFTRKLAATSVQPDVTARFTMWGLVMGPDPGKPVVLVVRPADQPNNAYVNAMLKSPSLKRAMAGIRGENVDTLNATATESVELYAKHIVAGWENVVEDDGSAPACTPEKVKEFLTALIAPPPAGRPDLFRELRVFCGNIENFRGEVASAADLGKA